VLTREAPRRWWSWPRWAVGFAAQVLLYAFWVVLIAVQAHRIAAEQAADPEPVPDSASGYFVFFMVLVSLVLVAVCSTAAGVLCVFERLRAFGVGALFGTVLPFLVAAGYLLWAWLRLAGATDVGG
jgi:hypothetical protein